MSHLHDLSGLEQSAAIRNREVSCVELAEHYLDRSERLSDAVGAFVTISADQARIQAHDLDAHLRTVDADALPPLFGVACPVKDLNLVADMPVRFGSAIVDVIATSEDNVVTKMREGGLVFTGKTNTPEFGLPCYTEPDVAPPARTPWDLTRSAGGSSGGAAAAVAAGLAPIAHGSDGGGSIRIPSSVTGLVGLKPTRGRVSNGPTGDVVGDISTSGPIARTVADAAALLDVMAGGFPGDPTVALPPRHGSFLAAARREPGRCRIGFYLTPSLMAVDVHPDVITAIEHTAGTLASLGHDVEQIASPFNNTVLPQFMALWTSLAAATPIAAQDEAKLRPLTRYLRQRGREVSGLELAAALTALRMAARTAIAVTAQFDAVLVPTLAALPAFVGQIRNDADPAIDFSAQVAYSPYCAVYNCTGQPSINVPLNWNEAGLPIGVQLVGRMSDEETIISLAAQLEAADSWHARIPAIW